MSRYLPLSSSSSGIKPPSYFSLLSSRQFTLLSLIPNFKNPNFFWNADLPCKKHTVDNNGSKIGFKVGGLGVDAFRRIYGGTKRNESRPRHFCKSSGSIACRILQQLQNVNIIDIDSRGGWKITANSQRYTDQIAGRIAVAI
ncbi:40S ribosomal protein S19-3-like [Hibiscus syriacus]|uniref:40S ribosomal protein S19-3-like n=1 Tax=Hibiscus syriacus TaxID=106335 RepID=UPI001921EDF3|nr:40S ribosomal protein S19-3-like [Hibiscus syriacus]